MLIVITEYDDLVFKIKITYLYLIIRQLVAIIQKVELICKTNPHDYNLPVPANNY